jgi:hypothetical protein
MNPRLTARDHVELPADFLDKAQEMIDRQLASPVKEELRGELTALGTIAIPYHVAAMGA